MIKTFYSILSLVIASGVFLTGIVMFSQSVSKATSSSARAMFNRISDNRFAGFGLGLAVTAFIQSSTATTVMVVGLVNAGLLTLFQAVAIMLGAHVGTSSTIFLVALSTFNIKYLFMSLVFIGAIMKLVTKHVQLMNIADLFVGFGILFVGLNLMSSALKDDIVIRTFFINLFLQIEFPLLLILLGMFFTMIIQSSTATMTIILTMIIERLLLFENALFLYIGAHIGTSFTAILASITTDINGKRAAIANALFSLFGAIILTSIIWPLHSIFVPAYTKAVPFVWQLPIFQVTYTLMLGAINIWFIKPVVQLSCFILKDKPERKSVESDPSIDTTDQSKTRMPFGAKYLQEQLIDANIDIALEMAKKEIFICADLVKEMFEKVHIALKNKNMNFVDEIRKIDVKIDILNKAIILFLAKISIKELNKEEASRCMNYIYISNELDSIGDSIDKNLMFLAKKIIDNNLSFSEQGIKELEELHGRVMDNLNRAVLAFKEENFELAKNTREVYSDINERKYQLSHIERLQKGVQPSLDTSSVHLDLVNYYARINEHIVNIANRILWLTDKKA